MKISALDIYLPTTYIFCILLCPIDQNYVKKLKLICYHFLVITDLFLIFILDLYIFLRKIAFMLVPSFCVAFTFVS